MARRLAAILAADVVGFSRLMGMDEAGTLDRLNSLLKNLVQPKIAARGGRIVKLIGDGLLAEFPSVVEAVQCAVEIQKSIIGRETDLPDGGRIKLRIGVNLGDIIVEGSDIYGDGVNVAARLEGLAEPGGICVSGTVFDHVKNKVGLVFADLGSQEVKNIDEPVRVFRIKLNSAAEARRAGGISAEQSAGLDRPDKPSIAVLPFTNLSGDPEQEHFADGIAEDLITQLSRLRDLLVIARNSTFVFKGRAVPISQVATDLGVRYVLEGSVRRSGNRLRVTTQLIDAATDGHVWAERYDREETDLFELQDEITKAVTVALQVRLTEGEAAVIAAEGTRNLRAWELYLQGHTALMTWTKLENFRARRLFEQAIVHDPDYGMALVELAWTHWVDARFRYTADPAVSLELAKTILGKVKETIGETGSVLLTQGIIALMERRYDEALEYHQRAIELTPSYAYCWGTLGMIQVYVGDFQGAIASLKASLRLSPLGLNYATYYLAFAYLWLGDLERARSCAASYLARDPQEPFAYLLSAIVETASGRLDVARDHISMLLDKHPEITCEDFAHAQHYRDPKWLERLLSWLKEAGLPDHKDTHDAIQITSA